MHRLIWLSLSLAGIISCFPSFAQTIESLEGINSPYDQHAPVISPDGEWLYYTVAKHPGNAGGKADGGDIWCARRDSAGNWGYPKPVRDLNNADYNAVAGFSPDGNTIYLHGTYSGREQTFLRGLSQAQGHDTVWNQPTGLVVKFFKNVAPHQSGVVSAQGQYLVLALEGFSSRGAEDLYVAFRQPDGSYTGLKNLGDAINTKFQEMTPYLAPDGKTLFFASNGRGGQGRDLYRTTRLDDTWINWSTPEPLSTSINSKGVELYYFIDPAERYAYFTSNTDSEGYGDIYRYLLPQEADSILETQPLPEPPLDTLVEDTLTITDLVDSLITDTTVAIVLAPLDSIITDSITEQVTNIEVPLSIPDTLPSTETYHWIIAVEAYSRIDSTLLLARAEATTVDHEPLLVGPDSGTLQLSIPDSIGQIKLRVAAAGYFAQELPVIRPELVDSAIALAVFLSPLEVGATVNLENVLFKRGTNEMLPGADQDLKQVIDLMVENPKVAIELGGHTDNRGNPQANLALSKARVETVKRYLVAAGIDPERIDGKGYGGSQPIADNDDDEQRMLNRRVELKIIRNDD